MGEISQPMNSYRNDPDGEANQQATRESERYVGGLKLQAHAVATIAMKPTITESIASDGALKAEFSPGNGYRYTVLAVLLNDVGDMGAMGAVEPCWLVAVGNNGSAYLLADGRDFISVRYVAEKFRLNQDDAAAVAACIADLLDRETDSEYWRMPEVENSCTNPEGHRWMHATDEKTDKPIRKCRRCGLRAEAP